MHHRSSIHALAAVTALALVMSGCLPFGDEGAAKDSGPKGDGVKLEDVYAATMALVGTSQLTHVFVPSPDEAFDGDAAAMATDIEAALKANATCVTVSRDGAKLTLDFGAGCAPPKSGVTIQGKVEATLAVDKGKSMTVSLALTDFGASDKTASGTGSLKVAKAADGFDLTVTVNASAGDAVLEGGLTVDLVVASDKKSFASMAFSTVDPTKVTVGTSELLVDADGVTFGPDACYPSAGSILVTSAGLKATLAFNADTASTGVAQFTPPLSKKADDKQLPGLGWKCK